MATGGLIAESLRVGATLDAVPMMITKISRFAPGDTVPGEPDLWTLIDFEIDDDRAPELAVALEAVLEDTPLSWYCDFHTADESFVVFPRRTFRYPRGDRAARAEPEAYGRSVGVPESQLDWPE